MFGVEVNLEAVLSPTHLMLMAGGLLVLSAALHRAWSSPRSDASDSVHAVPLLDDHSVDIDHNRHALDKFNRQAGSSGPT